MRPNLRSVLHSRICRQSFRGHITTALLILYLLIYYGIFCKLLFLLNQIRAHFVQEIEINMTGSFDSSLLKLTGEDEQVVHSCEISNGACEIHAFRVTTQSCLTLGSTYCTSTSHSFWLPFLLNRFTYFSTKTYTMTQRWWELLRRFMRRFAHLNTANRTKQVKCSCCVDNTN